MREKTIQPKRGIAVLTLPVLALLLAGCQEPTTYPISGEECDPNDPVQTLDAADCMVP